MTEDADRPTREALVSIALFTVAFVLRFLAARWLAGEPVWDGHYYDFGARRIAEGHGYSDDRVTSGITEWHPWCHYPVGYSAYLAAFYWLFGAKAWSAHLANALAGALVPVVVHRLGCEAFGPGARARLGGAIAAVHPGLVLYGALVMGEVVAALGTMAAFWVAIRFARTHGRLRGIVAGAFVLGVSALVRPQALLCAPAFALVAWNREESRWKNLAYAALACAVALVPVLPWTARNCAVMDGCALVSTNAGWNLAIGAFPRATGRFETLRSEDGCRDVTGQVQQDRCWLRYGIANIEASPGRWLGLVPAKLHETFDHESFAVEYLHEARPEEWPDEARVRWRGVLTAFHRLLLVLAPLAFVALVRARRGRELRAQGLLLAGIAIVAFAAASAATPLFWPLAIVTCVLPWLPLPGRPPASPALLLSVVLLATTALTHAVFFGEDRYHVVATPALCLLVAAALRPNTRAARTPLGVRAAGEGQAL